MDTLFPISDLRTLVARALQEVAYTPASSARVRAVPDTRTIRYYTTLGLIDRPDEMRGRTAYYGPRHVLQLVAVKRLQADDLTLSDIQEQLTALTPKKLESLAALPADFWKCAEAYLQESRSDKPSASKLAAPQASESADSFWARPAALPSDPVRSEAWDDAKSSKVVSCIRLTLHPQVQVHVESRESETDSVDLQRLQAAADSLLSELVRQGLLKSPASRTDEDHS